VWQKFWQLTMQAYNTGGANISTSESVKAFDAVATGRARILVFEGISTRREHRGFTVGAVRFEVSEVRIDGGAAVIRGCVDDRSYEVDDQGRTVVPPPGRQPFADSLARSGNRWLVSGSQTISGRC
jgi:hypothetical protein